jgi:hypothetical protein
MQSTLSRSTFLKYILILSTFDIYVPQAAYYSEVFGYILCDFIFLIRATCRSFLVLLYFPVTFKLSILIILIPC